MNIQGTAFTQSLGTLQCISGVVNLFRFIMAPPPGSIIGNVTPFGGAPVPLVQTQPTPLGGTPLSSVDGQFATVCGVFTTVSGQVALDVRVVNPGAPSPTGTPPVIDNRLLLLLILLLLILGGRRLNLGTVNLSQLLGTGNITSVLGQLGISRQEANSLLAQLGSSIQI